MRHRTVQQVSLGLAASFVLAGAWFAWTARHGNTPEPLAATSSPLAGEAAFTRHCARCHRAEDLARPLREAQDRVDAVLGFIAYLDHHGRAQPAEVRGIVRFLLQSR